MELWEIISAIIGSNAVTGVVTFLVNKKSLRIKNTSDQDEVFRKRIDFLDERITELEKRVCFRTTCKDRI